jgi:hypothetical protein
MRKTGVGALACALGVFGVAPAVAAATSVKISSWHVYTQDEQLHKVKPGKRFKACPANPVIELDAKGAVKGAKKGKAFKEIWSVDGHKVSTEDVAWSRSGSFTDYFGTDPQGQNGKWKLKLVQGSKTIGTSTITLGTNASC